MAEDRFGQVRTSSGVTKSRPFIAACARLARSRDCVARGPAPTRTRFVLARGAHDIDNIADELLAHGDRLQSRRAARRDPRR